MNHSLIRILISAKKMKKWVPIKHLTKYYVHEINLMQLEDDGLLLIYRHSSDGILIKLTMKGYHFFSRQQENINN
ncbi:hypothetical protein [Pseudobacillus badius]|uniref:hypothetical protein n=1 Tax=Bacillus badius TaxID=1455 RepID=UPI0024A50FAD|nr:hypothetical protein [Bacillus badius]MED0667949.1 hypothetical protein [Bacillus badius]GLY11441.1 hypothetical protein Bbad01_26570 [Bacillus badius]